jgi:cytochrome c oxidase cbb3-type subunit 2
MPAYGWLRENPLRPASIERHMKVNGFPYTAGEIAGLADKTELDALIAYMQAIGVAVKKAAPEERPEALRSMRKIPWPAIPRR